MSYDPHTADPYREDPPRTGKVGPSRPCPKCGQQFFPGGPDDLCEVCDPGEPRKPVKVVLERDEREVLERPYRVKQTANTLEVVPGSYLTEKEASDLVNRDDIHVVVTVPTKRRK